MCEVKEGEPGRVGLHVRDQLFHQPRVSLFRVGGVVRVPMVLVDLGTDGASGGVDSVQGRQAAKELSIPAGPVEEACDVFAT